MRQYVVRRLLLFVPILFGASLLGHPEAPEGWVEGWFFKDKKVRGVKPGVTVYDNNMKAWIAQ